MRNVEGYIFLTEEDAEIAREEVAKINYISSKLKEDNPKAVLAVYTRIIQSNMFITPIGYEYLNTLKEYLYKSPEIKDEIIPDIPARINYSDFLKDGNKGESNTEKKQSTTKNVKTYKNEYVTSLIFNVIMVIAVLVMFGLALRADTPNIINYRNAITNEYSEWDQQLKEKENELRERENALVEREEMLN